MSLPLMAHNLSITIQVAHQTLSYFSAPLLCTLCHCYPRLCCCWCILFIIIGLFMTLAEVMQSTACQHHRFHKFHITVISFHEATFPSVYQKRFRPRPVLQMFLL